MWNDSKLAFMCSDHTSLLGLSSCEGPMKVHTVQFWELRHGKLHVLANLAILLLAVVVAWLSRQK